MSFCAKGFTEKGAFDYAEHQKGDRGRHLVRDTSASYSQQLGNPVGSNPDLQRLSFPDLNKEPDMKPIVNAFGDAWERPKAAVPAAAETPVHLLPESSRALFRALDGAASREEAIMEAQIAEDERKKKAVEEAIAQTRAEQSQAAFDAIKTRSETALEERSATVGGAIFEAGEAMRAASASKIMAARDNLVQMSAMQGQILMEEHSRRLLEGGDALNLVLQHSAELENRLSQVAQELPSPNLTSTPTLNLCGCLRS